MQHWAREINLSETAFVSPLSPSHPPSSSYPSSSPPASFSLRWFTPVLEVDLCGHATLAAAHALWQTGRITNIRISEKRAVSVYGLGKFPITLYCDQWRMLLAQAEMIEQFLTDNAAKLAKKEG